MSSPRDTPKPPVSARASALRRRQLGESIERALSLQKECEDALRLSDRPLERARLTGDVERLIAERTAFESELEALPDADTAGPAGTRPVSRPGAGASPEPVTILFLAANPVPSARLDLDEEARDVEAKLRAAEHRATLRLRTRWAVRPDDLIQALLEDRPRIVHFSGHGTPKGLVLHGSKGPRIASRGAILDLFRALKDDIRVVVLNACYTRQQAAALAEVIDCVVGMRATVGDTAARTFAASFYRALGFARSVQNAFDQGVAAAKLHGLKANGARLFHRPGVEPDRLFILETAPGG
jgi:hypothetical protein